MTLGLKEAESHVGAPPAPLVTSTEHCTDSSPLVTVTVLRPVVLHWVVNDAPLPVDGEPPPLHEYEPVPSDAVMVAFVFFATDWVPGEQAIGSVEEAHFVMVAVLVTLLEPRTVTVTSPPLPVCEMNLLPENWTGVPPSPQNIPGLP